MSAIGEYVHLKYDNYLKYGTSRFGQNKQTIEDSYNAQKRKNADLVSAINVDLKSNKELDILKKRISTESLQNFSMNTAESEVIGDKDLETVIQKIKKQLINEVGKDIGKTTYLTSGNLEIDMESVSIDSAIEKRKRLYKQIDAFNADSANLSKNTNMESKLRNINNSFEEFFKYLGISSKKGNSILDSFKIKGNTDTLTALKSFLKKLQLTEIKQATINGKYGEMLVSAANDACQSYARNELKDYMIKTLETGEYRTSFSIDESDILSGVKEVLDKSTKNAIYRIYSTQDKVDASIEIKGRKIDASVKAYSSRYGKSLTPHLQDVNLLSSLITTEKQFANHWINLHVSSAGTGAATAQIDEELKKHIAYEALASGNMLKKNTTIANTFVAIDVKSGKVYTETVADILTNKLGNFKFNPNVNSIVINNAREDSLEKRIANIVRIIKGYKIAVKLKVSLT